MTGTMSDATGRLSRHWFLPVAAVVVAGDLSALHWGAWASSSIVEAALLFDFVLLLPLLYGWCYRRKGKAAAVQAIALACFAIWATGKAIPVEQHHVLNSIGWLRTLGLAGLLAVEIKLGVAVYKAVVLSGKSRREAEARLESEGIPPWLAKLMSLEATFWRRVWRLARNLFWKSK